MKKIMAIAWREFVATVTRKSYVVALLALPLLTIIAFGVITAAGARALALPRLPAAVVDQAHILGAPISKPFVLYQDLDRALRDLEADRLSACYRIEPDYLQTGKITSFRRSGIVTPTPGARQEELAAMLRAALLRNRLSGAEAARVVTPVQLDEMELRPSGELRGRGSREQQIGSLIGAAGLYFMFVMTMFMSSGAMLQSLTEEKKNRVLEVILSSVTTDQFLAGKILGLGAPALLQTVVYLAIGGISTLPLMMAGRGIGFVLWSLAFSIGGYLLFATLMTGTGMIAGASQESTQIAGLWSMFSILPPVLLIALPKSVQPVATRCLSLFPFTAPGTMLFRLSFDQVGTAETIVTLLVLMAGIVLAARFTARLFRATALLYGKRITLGEVMFWLRQA